MFKKVIFVLTLLCFQSLIASDIINIDKSVLPEFLKDGQVKVKGKILKDGSYKARYSLEIGPAYGGYIKKKLKQTFSVANGKINGPYRVYSSDGQKVIEGSFKNGQKQGSFTRYYASGEKYSEEYYEAEKLDGLLTTYVNLTRDDKKKNPRLGRYNFKSMEKNYIDGKIQGKATKYYTYNRDGVNMKKFSELKKRARIVYGKGKKEYILFMDSREYSKKFEQVFPSLYDDVTFYIYDYDSNNYLRFSLNLFATPTVFDISGEDVSPVSFKALSEKNIKRGLIAPNYTTINGLMWQEVYDYSPLIGRQTNEKKYWHDAEAYCRDLNYAGYSDWTLPTKLQLLSLYYNRSQLKNNIPKYFWSSTEDESGLFRAWEVRFSDGRTHKRGKGGKSYVRCVR